MAARVSGLNQDRTRTFQPTSARPARSIVGVGGGFRPRNLNLFNAHQAGRLAGRGSHIPPSQRPDVDRRSSRVFQAHQIPASRGTARRGPVTLAESVNQLKRALARSAPIGECFALFMSLGRETQFRCYELLFRERIINEGIDQFLSNPLCVLPLLDQFGAEGRSLKRILEGDDMDLTEAFPAFMRLHPDQQMRCYELLCRQMIIEEGVDEFLSDPSALMREVRANGRRLPIIDHLLSTTSSSSRPVHARPTIGRPAHSAAPRGTGPRRDRDIPVERPSGAGAMPRLQAGLRIFDEEPATRPVRRASTSTSARTSARTDRHATDSRRNTHTSRPDRARSARQEPDEPYVERPDANAVAARFAHFGAKINRLLRRARAKINEDVRGQLDTFLGRLSETADYREAQSKVLAKVERILDGLCRNEEFQEKVGAILTQANTSCSDRVATYFAQMEMQWRICCDPAAKTLPGLSKLLIGLRRMEIIEEHGRRIATRNGNEHEELATILGLQRALWEQFELPISIGNVNFAGCAHLNDRDIQEVETELLTLTADVDLQADILMENENWGELIKAQARGLDALEEGVGDLVTEIPGTAWDHDPGDHERDHFVGELGRVRETMKRRILKRATIEFLNRSAVGPAQ